MAGHNARPLTARTPWRQVYALYRLTTVFIRLPYWIVTALISRPRNWTIKQTILNSFFKDFVDRFSLAGVTEPTSLDPGKQGSRFKVIDPAQFPPSFYQGPAVSANVHPAKVGGTWYPAEPADPTAPTGPIFLWIHGGAFVMGNSRDDFFNFTATTLLTHAGAQAVFSVEYRLSGYGQQNPFPAAFQDVLTAYLYLTETLRVPAGRITVGGDSAGGNLALAFLRYVEQYGGGDGIKRPGSATLASPWVSPLDTLDPACGYTRSENWDSDYLPLSFLRWGATTYPPTETGAAEKWRAYVTPLGNGFATRVPVLVWFGGREVLRAGIEEFAEEMGQVEGNTVEVFEEEDASHDSIIIGNVLGSVESVNGVAVKIGEFVKRHQT